jgi:hypothetical protein
MASVIPDLSPTDVLGRFRGTVTDAARSYPEVIHITLKDADGGEWWFSTYYADYAPSDPEFFLGKTVVDVDFELSGRLTMRFSDDSEFNVLPEPEGPDDALWFRPRGRWDLGLGSDPC